MAEATMVTYGKVSGSVTTQGILHYFEDAGCDICPAMEMATIEFGGDHLLAPTLDVSASWKSFQGAWKKQGKEAATTMMDEAHLRWAQ
ncbi:hypothetical protein GUJ93_ZPchr0005g15513 [Zizania palustris]|uniref:Uncharacterized protein n=1 Tax=Zizania palustris TaxID=103762 RepID=A0A8J5S5E3_ZIZPA|nr:hypothetical protein GUJ93_ZPchr0005g15513 [Zizania palustris]